MFKTGGYIKIIFLTIFCCILCLNSTKVRGQCANISGQGSSVSPGVGCSPHIENFTTEFNVINLTATDIAFEVDWGDGSNDVYILGTDPEISTSVTGPNTEVSLDANHTYTSGTMCSYEIVSNLRFDGVSCSEQQVQNVVVWDNDNVNGGTVAMTPDEYEVCAGSEVTVNFTDATDFNCTPPDYEDSNPNFFARTYAFEYGTTNNIANIEVDGAVQTYPYYDGIVFNTTDGDLDNNNQVSYDIFVPSSANIGEQFEITLYYWNFCNPFNGNAAAPNFGAAQTATALITIVQPPEPEPQVFDANEDFASESGNDSFWYDNSQPTQRFCADETIYFRQDPSAVPGTDYAWDFDWDDGTPGTFNSMATGPNANFSYDALTYAGETVEVRLRISRGDVGTPCIFYESIEIEIEEGPQADFDLDVNEGCEEIAFNTINNSNVADGYEWSISQISGPAGTIEDISSQQNDFELTGINITGPGVYEVELLATSTIVTSCPNTITKTITIYENPDVDFSATEVCFGDATTFTDLSDITNVVNGDFIEEWEFVFDFDSTNFKTDPEGTFDTESPISLNAAAFTANEYEYTYPAAGTYYVALRVTTDNGCVSPIKRDSVVVKENPISNFEFADNGTDYSQSLCPGTPVEIKNTSPAGQTDPAVDRYYVEIISQDNTNDGDFPTAPGSISAGDSVIINPNSGDLPNPFSAATYTYDFYFIAVGDNNCETREGPLSVTFLPSKNTDFDIYTDDAYGDIYDPNDEFCSPNRYYFQLDSDITTDLNDDDSLVWTITDITNSQFITDTTVLVDSSEPYSPDTISFNFVNEYPEISAVTYEINLQPYIDGICYDFQEKTVRVLPKPTSEFNPVDTVVTCDSVTYYFEAEQPGLLTYDWQVQTIADTLSTQNDGAEFWVSYARPDIGDPAVNVEVRLETTNPFGCQSDLSDPFNDTIQPKENINIILDTVGNEFCAPSVFGFVNKTDLVTDPVPPGTEWELIIKNLDLNDSTIINGNSLTGNTDFRDSTTNIFEYEFTDSANYEIRLNALLPSTCDVASDPPISLGINETPTANFRTNITEGCSPLSVDILGASTIPSGQDFFLYYEITDTTNNSFVADTVPILGDGSQLNGVTLPTLTNTSDPFIDYAVKVTAESKAGCLNDSTVFVRVFQEPSLDFDITSPNPACQEDYTFEFDITTLNVPTGTSFTWNWDDGESLTTDQDTAVNHVFSNRASFFDDDSYTVTLTAETPNNCTFSVSKVVELHPQIQAQFNANPEEGCDSFNVTFTSSSLGRSISGGHEYFKRLQGETTWDPIGGTISNSGTATEPFENDTDTTQIWEILYVVEGEGPCADTADIKEITVFPSPDFEVNVIDSPLCQIDKNGDYEFEFELNNVDVPAGTEFTWNWGDGSTELVTTSTNNQFHIFQNRLSYFGSDNYTVTVTAETDSSCILNKTVNIQLHPQIEASYNVNQTENCSPATFIFTSTSRGTNLTGNHQYFKRLQGDTPWQPFDATVSPAGNVTEILTNTTNTNEIWEILYTVESAAGCIDSTDIEEITVFSDAEFDVNVVESPLCQANLNGNYEFEFSLDNVDVPTGTTFTWEWGDGSSESPTTSTANQSHIFKNRLSYFETDNYTVTVTAETQDGCILNKTVDIQLNPQIEAIFFMDQTEACSPFEVNLSSSSRGTGITGNYRYQKRIQGESAWTNIAGGANNGITSDTLTNTGNGDLIYEIRHIISSDVGNCADTSAIQELTVYPEFSSPNITGPSEVCSFEQEVVYSIPHSLGSTYNWQLPLGAFISSQNANGNQVKINFSSFSGDVQVTEINANGCFGEPSLLPVTVLSGPSVSLSLNGPNTICPGDETSLIFDLSGEGSQGFDVIYSDGVENDTLENINDGHVETITPTQSRNYFVLDVVDREYPNCNAASVSGNAFVNVNFAPTASILGDATICEDGSTNLFINLTGAGPWEVVFTDQNSNYTIEDITSPVYQLEVSPEENTTYELVSVTDSNMPVCSGTVEGSASVSINPKPTAVISGNFDNICANESVELGIELTGFAPWTIRYTDGTNTFTIPNITPPAGYDPENDTYVHNFEIFPNTGTTNYSLIDVRDSNTPNCTGDISGTAVVTAYERPQVEIEGDNTICFGESSDITFNFTGDGPFDVIMTANQDSIEYTNLQDGQSVTLTPESSTVYRVIELKDIRGCSGNSLGGPVSINVNNLPTSEISGNDVTCNGEETELIFDQSGVGPWTITYTDGDQNYSFTTAFNRHFEPVFPTTTTTYSLVSVVDSNSPDSCTGTVSGSALKDVYPELNASFEASPEEMILPESTVTITNNTTNKNEWEYEWDFGDGTTSSETDPAPHEYGTFGTFVIRMTATNGQCTDTYQTSVTIGAIPPIIDFDANPTEGCLPLVVEFENLTQFADPSTYQWEFGDGQRISAVENPTHVYRNPGTYTVTLSATNITGQRTEMVKEEFIVVNETPVASFTIPDEYRQVFTTEEVRFVNLSEGADEFIWKFGDGNESFEEEPIHAYPDSGIYDITLIAINSETGCTDSMTLSSQVQVILGGTSDTPNAFTPSRAGAGTGSSNPNQNDFFLPKVEGVSQFNMKIYNRWGELLFESDDKTVGWDGYYNGVLMPQGVYVYRLELVYENGRRETKIGDITLIR